jgi:hypothetical protein
MADPAKLRDYPSSTVRFVCEKCGRAGQYSKQHLIWRFGADITLPDLSVRIANCERSEKMNTACAVRYSDWPVAGPTHAVAHERNPSPSERLRVAPSRLLPSNLVD